MPPSSARRVGLRSRREPDVQQHSDADTPDSIATPSRKRRRVDVNGAEPAVAQPNENVRTRITESVASNDSNATLPNGADADVPLDGLERQNQIINHLRTPPYVPHAAVDYANDLQLRKMEGENVAAFAKIAARDWCFFVQKTRFIIGRADAAIRPNLPGSSQSLRGLPQSDAAPTDWGVDIDLGPERQVSRVHAEIDYDPSVETWFITVNSRNGLKLDDTPVQKGARVALHSGICIGVMGTQMVFLLPGQEDEFHPMLYRQIKADREANDTDEEGNPPSRNLPHAHPSGPTPKREAYDPFPPTSGRNRAGQPQMLSSTPGRPMPNTPMAFRSTAHSQGSPAYPRGMLMDSTEDIDYSKDSAKDLKPPHSYAQLIGQAILSSPDEMLTLANIYDYIKARYAYFRHTSAGWQNSIRHNLSLNKSFEKIARRTDEPGKGMKWKIADNEREDFIKKQMLNPRKGGGGASFHAGTSGPNSPAVGNMSAQRERAREYLEPMQASEREPFQASERLQGALDDEEYRKSGYIKSPPRSATPPLSTIPAAAQSFTPERGPRSQTQIGGYGQFVTPAKKLVFPDENRQPTFAKTEDVHRGLESSPSVDPVKQNVSGLRDEAANSPPTLYSDTPANNANGNQEAHRANAFVTPFVARHAPHLAPPSTAQMPSHYINFSSPAPFWKYVDLPSTPAKAPVDLSPIKMKHDTGKDGAEEDLPQPSSPPLIGDDEPSAEPEDKGDEDDDVAPESPSRTMSRPVSRQVGSTQHRSRSNSNIASNIAGFEAKTGANGGMVRGASLTSFEEEPEEEGFDLSK